MRLGTLAMDLRPLRSSRDFRLMFWARVIALLGISLTLVGLSVQVYQLTHSSLAVAMVNAAAGATLLAGTLAGGILADRYERRQLLVLSRSAAAAVFAALALNAFADEPRLWVVYLCAAAIGVIDGISETALLAITPNLVTPDQLAAAGALTAITTQVGTMVGPSVGGMIIAGPGVAFCYSITCVATVVQVALTVRVRRRPPTAVEHRHPIRAMREGLSFVRRNRVIGGLLLMDVAGGLFALPYAVFPEIGERVLHGDPRTIGLLYSAPAVGAFLGAAFSGWVGRVRLPGRALTGTMALWGLGMAAFGFSRHLPLALVFLGVAGLGMILSEILQRSLLQRHTPDHLMGRVSSFWLAQATVGPAAGSVVAGGAASVVGPSAAVVVGGLLCACVVVLVAVALPGFRRVTSAGVVEEESGDGTAEDVLVR
ncbi:enterobactin transporter EntS [Actinopolymorpha sp. B17G11]|uniref:enterobactin transporter EntS n=1 Tax=Actinopolymorpha sp. B17G11 TaxID=3160861 RepID=UPI0032E4330C